jgi:transposase
MDLLTAYRSDAKYCSDACKSRAYRTRKAKARKLWAGGKDKSVKEIAQQLDVEEATVTGWLTRQRKRKEK